MSPTEMMTDERRNPLLDYTPMTISDWDQWMNAWHKAKYAEYKHELLHIGLDLIHRDDKDALAFYLHTADGHLQHGISAGDGDYGDFYWPGDHRTKSGAEIRKLLASKAFTVLVNKFFAVRSNEHRDNVPDWVGRIFMGGVLEDVVWFLRCEERPPANLETWGSRNFTTALNRPENERVTEVMTAFIVYLTKLAFNRRFFDKIMEREVRNDTERKERYWDRLVAIRPQLIEPLSYIGQLDLLLESGVEIDEEWLIKLRELVRKSVNTDSISLAVFYHNKAAMVLQNLQTIQEGQKLAEAEAKVAAAQAEADELRNSQK